MMTTNLRKSRLAAIHMGKKALNLDEDTYRDLLQSAAGVQSAADANADQLVAILRRMESLGFQQTKREFGTKPKVKQSKAQLVNKIEALLAEAGRHWAYAEGCAKKMFQKEKIEFCTDDELWRMVAALEKDKKRRAEKAAKEAQGG
jgi:phage gp16-like protein